MSIIRDPALAQAGLQKINWVKDYMPVLRELEGRFKKEQPFKGMRITVCIHVEAKTAYFGCVLKAGGADVAVTASNPLSTKDDVCAALDSLGVNIYAWHGATESEYHDHQVAALAFCPHVVIDDGGDLVALLHGECKEYAKDLIGGSEETTTGIHRLKARVEAGELDYPMIAVNDADSKYLFDNRHGTGQSTWDAIMYTTNNMISGRTVVVAGYGHCGSGIATRAKGLGANVIVTEVNPFRALEAAMDGLRVMHMDDAAREGDLFVTATGNTSVITRRHFEVMKDGVLLANSGHFDIEVDKVALREMSDRIETRKPFVEGYYLKDGRVLNLLADGRLVNIVAGNGHPADIMDMSFALQGLTMEYLVKHGSELAPGLYNVPKDIDEQVSMIKVRAMGLGLDVLTPEQERYLSSMG